MDLKNILAKSSGEDFISHTDKVANNVKILAKKHNLAELETEVLVLAALLHDIGKLVENIQSFFKKGKSHKNKKLKFPHNILGWYFVTKYLDHHQKDRIANLILWHHANNDSCENLNIKLLDISKSITHSDLELMKNMCSYYKIPLCEHDEADFDLRTSFYEVDMFTRCLLIASDVSASSNLSIDELFKKEIFNKLLINSEFLSSSRTQNQLNIINQIQPNTTSLIKAPTGFGKTMIAILWSIFRDNKLIWVCPTNVIAVSMYENIIRDLKLMGIDISVELYLTSERKKANNNLPDFTSDIIVTNIDNFITPTVTNKYGVRCLMIYEADVVFDEPDEYDSMVCSLSAFFNYIMDVRHNKLKSTTVLLTATPSPPRFLKKNGASVNVLPNTDEHYKPVHDDAYHVHFHETAPIELMTGEFMYFNNTVEDTQDMYLNYNGDKLISHGKYLDEDKEIRKNIVLSNYGKNGARLPLGVFSNQYLTRSCDYSVKLMFLKAPPIKEFCQAIGRLNRWGGMGETNIHIILEKSKSDRYFIGDFEENRLQELFINELRESFEFKSFTLKDFYIFYNKFLKENYKTFNEISIRNLAVSKNMLKDVFPKKVKQTDSGIKVANGNKLRRTATSNDIFISIKRSDSEERVTLPINIPKYTTFTKLFNEDENTYKNQVKVLKTFEDYNKYKTITPEIIIGNAIYSDTPYPVFNHVYHSELGLRKITE